MRLPWWFWLGLGLALAAWATAWVGPAPWSEYTFFPLWLGYILAVDGLTYGRVGSSLVSQSPARFASLFAVSVPLWWVFELANRFLGNWAYVLPRPIGGVEYALRASIAFSTVVPALFVTAGLYRTFAPFRRPIRWIAIAPSRAVLVLLVSAGALMFVGSLAVPRYLFPLVWIGLFLALDPLNALLGFRSLTAEVRRGRWDTVLVLFAAGLTCGFFWELWNWGSLPKWDYEVPFVGEPKLFEMPLLGYGGYLPFALEVFAAYHLVAGLLFRRQDADGYAALDAPTVSLTPPRRLEPWRVGAR